jgi:hypothetical protein
VPISTNSFLISSTVMMALFWADVPGYLCGVIVKLTLDPGVATHFKNDGELCIDDHSLVLEDHSFRRRNVRHGVLLKKKPPPN